MLLCQLLLLQQGLLLILVAQLVILVAPWRDGWLCWCTVDHERGTVALPPAVLDLDKATGETCFGAMANPVPCCKTLMGGLIRKNFVQCLGSSSFQCQLGSLLFLELTAFE